MRRTLTGKNALVTGGSRGIGAAIVRRLAGEGADVAFTFAGNREQAEKSAKEARKSKSKVLAIQADSADAGALVAAVDGAAAELGGLDILVNSAGLAVIAPLEEFRLEDLDRTLAVNVRAVFLASQAAARHMGQGGRIVNVGSCNAERVPFVGGSVYAMSKAALVGLVKGLSRDLAPRGITVNNVAPGPVNTDLNPDGSAFASMLKDRFLALKRYADADEIAGMVAYLAGPEAGYVTGASLAIDGGFTS
ncbi:3-oxoacyl-ACP reductase family protein [Fundidesulfovibrio agrisoli]|uniref:3-oxoacyl-ACP reductase family protein n=1 Tax=Fundidesulfovibrio agrisoli TaxID=2922717 RepID=UPI001FAE159A|nr:3-oxoacyl-ACP reductase family protein [Fundidesulfovibrio agrisoli]